MLEQGQTIRSMSEKESYTYLGLDQARGIKHKDMKEALKQRLTSRVKSILKTHLSAIHKIFRIMSLKRLVNQRKIAIARTTDDTLKLTFKSYFESLDDHYEQFKAIHNEVIGLLDDDTDDTKFEAHDVIHDQFHIPGPIDLLIGAELSAEIAKLGRIPVPQGQPLAIKTIFGWVLLGATNLGTQLQIDSYFVSCEHSLESTIRKFWELEAVKLKTILSPDENRCEEVYKRITTRDASGFKKTQTAHLEPLQLESINFEETNNIRAALDLNKHILQEIPDNPIIDLQSKVADIRLFHTIFDTMVILIQKLKISFIAFTQLMEKKMVLQYNET
ncbi:unnamed protein product [Acanthoscelides obtectus]|uniref:Peptidase aspartic putative domain-containing protein n=1 Tax=Acanthoscelides obtectus TaxID=200917 RepID=A0A9P0MKW8_ACAOB|nr:unnamed protein product [Acanthoscelides obtectus]CAK1669278.1 hypothetical protein AOBTE_LOCUS26920 [Acanthoscelides obtectus]